MAEGDRISDDASDAATADGGGIDDGGAGQATSGAEAAGNDPAGFEPSGVGDAAQQRGEGVGEGTRPGDWNPGEHGGGGGELY